MQAQTKEEHGIQEDLMQLMNVRHCLMQSTRSGLLN